MKLKKKTITTITFAIGACVFISTAFADALLGSGYDKLKDSAKRTAGQMEQGLANYTIEALFTLKDNDKMLYQTTAHNKIDTVSQAEERSALTQYAGGKTSSEYSYSDKKRSIWKNGQDGQYYVNEYTADVERGKRFTNPFNEKGAPEVEKLVDAVVGNLKDYVQAETQPDGSKVYSGSLSETQVPAIVNAVSSFGMKQLLDQESRMAEKGSLPEIESDIYVKKVVGTAIENKSGLLESVTGDIILAGKDKNGVQHEMKLNAAVKLSDVGTTKIVLPDLTGAVVEKVSQTGGFSSKFVGKYNNDMVVQKDGKFVKIGEAVLEITGVDQGKVTGKYAETIKPEYAAQYADVYNFTFEYSPGNSMPTFTYKNAKGELESGQLHPSSNGKVYLELNIKMMGPNSYRSNSRDFFDGEFRRVFE